MRHRRVETTCVAAGGREPQAGRSPGPPAGRPAAAGAPVRPAADQPGGESGADGRPAWCRADDADRLRLARAAATDSRLHHRPHLDAAARDRGAAGPRRGSRRLGLDERPFQSDRTRQGAGRAGRARVAAAHAGDTAQARTCAAAGGAAGHELETGRRGAGLPGTGGALRSAPRRGERRGGGTPRADGLPEQAPFRHDHAVRFQAQSGQAARKATRPRQTLRRVQHETGTDACGHSADGTGAPDAPRPETEGPLHEPGPLS